MDAEDRPRGPMTGEVVDRELKALLAVDPSPEFVARVRIRIADEHEPRAWWLSWKLAGVVAVAAVVVLAVVLTRSRQTPAVAPPIAAGPKGPALQTQTAARDPEAFRVTPRVVTPRRPGPSGPGVSAADVASRESDVLLDPRETSALRALIRGVRRGDLDLEPVLRASTPSAMELPPITEIAIPPITIAPLVDEGVRP